MQRSAPVPLATPKAIPLAVAVKMTTLLREELRTLQEVDEQATLPGIGALPTSGACSATATHSAGPGVTLEQVLGSRPAYVVVRLERGPDGITARLTAPPRPGTEHALEVLRCFVEDRFANGQERLEEREWERLLGGEPARPVERLLLLTRLARPGSEPVQVSEQARVKPNNHGLENYARHFAALPDGTPFSLALLLGGTQRGKKSSDPGLANHPWGKLPRTVRLLALRRALHLERQQGRACKDDDFRDLLLDALNGLGLGIDEPLYTKQVRMLRDDLKKAGLDVQRVFPEFDIRRQWYAASGDKP